MKYLRQNRLDGSYDRRKVYKFLTTSEKNKGKDKQFSTAGNLNNADSKPSIHSSHMKIFQF